MYSSNSWLRRCLLVILTLKTIEEVMASRLIGCNLSLGMQSGSINNSQILASSSLQYTPPHSGRLFNTRSNSPISFGAWCAKKKDLHQYLLIDLLSVKNITGISSQGLQLPGDNWVSSYSISYSCDGRLWMPYLIGAIPKIFNGNNDTDSVRRNILPTPIIARVIRIHPITWNYLNLICMRVDIHGCQSNQVCRPTALPTTALPSTRLRDTPTQDRSPSTTSLPFAMTTEQTTTQDLPTTPSCMSSLGMEDNRIKDSQITASSFNTFLTKPSAARLNNRKKHMSFGSWCALSADSNQYLQIDLLRPTTIVAIATQGMAVPEGNWVSSYTLSYSCNGTDWFFYENHGKHTVFKANTDGQSTVKYHLETPITTRYVRLRPVTWNRLGNICLRMELYGCTGSQVCTSGNISDSIIPSTRPPQESHTIRPSKSTPIMHSDPTNAKDAGAQPTNQTKATKHKNRIVIIYKKIEDDVVISRSSRTNRISLTSLGLLALLLRLV